MPSPRRLCSSAETLVACARDGARLMVVRAPANLSAHACDPRIDGGRPQDMLAGRVAYTSRPEASRELMSLRLNLKRPDAVDANR